MMRIRSTTSPASLCRLFAFGLAVCVVALSPLSAKAQQVAARITEPVNNAARTVLHGGTPPLVASSSDLGALPASTPAGRMLLVLKRSDAQEMQLQQTLVDLHNPSSSQYHKWLTPAAFSSKFGPSDTDIQTITDWLSSQGFTVTKTTGGKAAIEFSGTAGQVNQAFHTELHTYENKGVVFHSNNVDPQIPSALATVVTGIASLNDVPPLSYSKALGTATFDPKTHKTVPLWSYPVAAGGVYLVTTPGDLAVQYDINPIYNAGTTGKGETIGIVSASGVDNTIVANYRSLFGLPANLPTEIVDGADPGSNGGGAGLEADLDVEVSGATAPNANIYLYTSYETYVSYGLFEAAVRAVDDNVADVITMSYGICEPTLGLSGNLLFSQLWSQAAAQGQSVFVSSGDSGGAGCDNGQTTASHGLAVNGISSTPYNVSVGGTDFYYSDYANSSTISAQVDTYWNTKGSSSPTVSLLQRVPEQPWNDAFGLNVGGTVDDSTTSSGSGGVSNCIVGTSGPQSGAVDGFTFTSYTSCNQGYAKPSWQSAPGVPTDGARDIPDISLFAANGANYSFYPVCAASTDCTAANAISSTGAVQITGVGGTSASSPLMAGIMALIDQSLGGRQGNPNFVLYALANQVPSVFHDVTVGNNNVPCTQGTLNCSLDTNGDGYYTLQKYTAGVGYDLASGLGSIDASALLNNWTKATFSSTTITLALSSTSFAHGTPVTVTSVVGSPSGTPTGAVALVSTSTASSQTSQGTVQLTNGTGQTSLNSLPAGTYTLTAKYGGDGKFAPSTSDGVTLNVTPENSNVAISGAYEGVIANGNNTQPILMTNGLTTLYGSFFDIDAKVYGVSSSASSPDGIATGTITVFDNGTQLTTMNLASNGIAELQTGSFAAGTHVLTFAYNGDGNFNASISAPYTINITKGIPQVLLSFALPAGVPVGGTMQIPVEVTTAAGQLPLTGTITVTLGSQQQTVQLSQSNFLGLSSVGYGTATFNISQTGTFPLNASYSGDSNLQPIATAYNPTTLTVYSSTIASTTTTVTMSSNSVSGDGSLTATVKVTGSTTHIPTGYVSLSQNTNQLQILNQLDATGTVVIAVPNGDIIASGTDQFVATYAGDGYNGPSESVPVSVTTDIGDYSLNISNAALAIKSGSTGTTTITVGAPYGQRLTGTVALTCVTSSASLGCSLSPTSITLPSDPTLVATSTLSITTQSQTASNSVVPRGFNHFVGGVGAVFAMLFFGLPRRKKIRPALFAAAFLTLLVGTVSGCSNPPLAPVSAAPQTASPGTYTATVTAVSSGITHTLVLKITVQ
jgi:hypothetical protein